MRVLAVLAFVLISSRAFAATSEGFGRGGWYKDFQPEIERANSSGELFRITGHCQSLCTIPGSTIIDTFGYRECPRQ